MANRISWKLNIWNNLRNIETTLMLCGLLVRAWCMGWPDKISGSGNENCEFKVEKWPIQVNEMDNKWIFASSFMGIGPQKLTYWATYNCQGSQTLYWHRKLLWKMTVRLENKINKTDKNSLSQKPYWEIMKFSFSNCIIWYITDLKSFLIQDPRVAISSADLRSRSRSFISGQLLCNM